MKSIRLLSINNNDPILLGHEHGETLRQQIKEIAEIRLERICSISFNKKPSQVLELAKAHIPILENFDQDLFLELKGISEASNVSLEKLIILNDYTDMRDIKPKNLDLLGGCSLIYTPGKESPILAQTWDTHASARPYVFLLKTPDFIVFTIAGCLGMAGLNNYGVGIAINNLNSTDAKLGIIWPALVRKALQNKTAKSATQEIMDSNIGSGHHYAIADKNSFFSIETSGTKKKIIYDKNDLNFFHTNHCLDKEMRQTHIIGEESNTVWRYDHLNNSISPNKFLDLEGIIVALKEVSMPEDPKNPHKIATCGTVLLDIGNRQVIACPGSPDEELLKWPQNFIKI